PRRLLILGSTPLFPSTARDFMVRVRLSSWVSDLVPPLLFARHLTCKRGNLGVVAPSGAEDGKADRTGSIAPELFFSRGAWIMRLLKESRFAILLAGWLFAPASARAGAEFANWFVPLPGFSTDQFTLVLQGDQTANIPAQLANDNLTNPFAFN